MNEGRHLWGCTDKSDLNRRCDRLDSLYRNIRDTGYKSQSEIMSVENTYHEMRNPDEIAVNVGRDGDLLFNNGAHRLAIAKLLGVDKIPIRITVRHPQWQKFREAILLYVKEHGGKIYSPITHPDLRDLPIAHGESEVEHDRFSIIEANLSGRRGILLDIGAHWGYFCHRFEEMGFECYAVEKDGMHLYFLEKLKRAENRKFKVVHESIFECEDLWKLHFDVVLALNVFHHFLKEEASYLKLRSLLGNLHIREMYFQPHNIEEPQMYGAYKNYSEEEFVEFVLQYSKLNDASFLGRARDGRGIYKLC